MDDVSEAASEVVAALLAHAGVLVTVESCTGGWVSKAITDVPGSSACFDRGFVTYSNAAKLELVGVSASTLETQGAVSEATVREMAQGGLERSRATLALAVSGIAGPSGGSPDKPVGMVCFAWLKGERCVTATHYLTGQRKDVRRQSVVIALRGVVDAVQW